MVHQNINFKSIEEAVKLKPDLIIIGHQVSIAGKCGTLEKYVAGFYNRKPCNKNEKYYNWILSEQILGNKRKHEKQHQAAWHATGMLYFLMRKLLLSYGKAQ